MAIQIGSARIDERGRASGGKVGDQTKGEVALENFYVHKLGWRVYRAKDTKHRRKLAELMIRACKNDNIGYDQSNRYGVIKYGIDTKTPTEADCSSLVRECIKEATGNDTGDFTTGTAGKLILKTGLFNDIGNYTSKTILYNGDILCTRTKGHIVIVCTGAKDSTTETSASTATNATNPAGVNLYEVVPTTYLNVRAGAGTNHKVVTTISPTNAQGKENRQGIDKVLNGWGHLSNNVGWISLKYTRRV